MSGGSLLLIPTLFEARALLANESLEVDGAESHDVAGHPMTVALTGVGPIAAAATALHWLKETEATRVLLVGLAGTLDPERVEVGQLLVARSITCHGVGAGEGEAHEPLPFPQVPAGMAGKEPVHSHLWLNAPAGVAGGAALATDLLTVTCAAADEQEAALRRRRYPDVAAEEMEGFGVAIAARLAGVPLVMLRGVSNIAGQRRVQDWNVREVLERANQWIGAWRAEIGA